MKGCPSDFALEESLVDSATEAARHAASCPDCAKRLAFMEEQRLLFRNFVRPATLDSILEHAPAGAAGGRRWWGWLGILTASAAAFALVVHKPAEETEHVKGPPGHAVAVPPSPLLMQVFAARGGVAYQPADGSEIPAGAGLRFRVAVPSPCQLSIHSIDATGTVSHLYPPGAPAKAIPAGRSELESGAQLDGVPGPERIFAICSSGAVGDEEIGRAVREAVQMPGLDAPGPLRLHDAALQFTLLLHKTR